MNSFSTALMVRLGKTFSNLMVEVDGGNSKLRAGRCASWSDASGAGRGDLRGRAGAADGELRRGHGPAAVGRERAGRAAGAGHRRRSVRGALAVLGVTASAPRSPRGQRMAADMGEQPAVLRALAARADEIAAWSPRPAPAGVLVFGRRRLPGMAPATAARCCGPRPGCRWPGPAWTSRGPGRLPTRDYRYRASWPSR